ncbi:single-stranded DNA-binding protein [Gryllotalpicola protaetiae]|nr:single-stranded DNA-binding protein [Gryllotalpicola protaetiae]
MSSTITVRGFVATQPKFVMAGPLAISSFRLASNDRRYNRTTGQWETGPTSWYSVSTFRVLATNVFASIGKGDPVIVTGRLKVTEWSAGGKAGLDVEIEAEGVGHDFRWGKASGFVRNNGKSSGGADDGAPAVDDEQPPAFDRGDRSGFVPEPSGEGEVWANPATSIASASSADAGEPAAFGFVAADEQTGEILEDA